MAVDSHKDWVSTVNVALGLKKHAKWINKAYPGKGLNVIIMHIMTCLRILYVLAHNEYSPYAQYTQALYLEQWTFSM